MYQCTFILNGEPLSDFIVGGGRFAGGTRFSAFSGMEGDRNKRSSACHPSVGPIPPGQYYIFDRQSGGRFGSLRDWALDREGWFALYKDDGTIDDETLCDSISRGAFRLHPKGPRGISQGCITLEHRADFIRLSAMLRSASPVAVKGTELKAYGMVTVS